MGAKITEEQLEAVRGWAANGMDLNGIQKKLLVESGVHLTYMEVRFLLLDNGIEITEPEQPSAKALAEPDVPPQTDGNGEEDFGTGSGKVKITLDDLQLPGAIFSGKAEFPSGAAGSWQFDRLGQFRWSKLDGRPSAQEMQDFERELTVMLSRR